MVEQAKTKEDLEALKLSLEIAELKKPLWKRPSTLGVAAPTALAFGTLLVGAISGFFNVQLEKISVQSDKTRNENVLLEIEKDKLHQEVAALRTGVDREREKVEAEKKEIGKQLVDEKQRLKIQLETEREKLNAELTPLREELASTKREIQLKDAQLAKTNEELVTTPIRTLIGQMESSSNGYNDYQRIQKTVVELIGKDKRSIQYLEGSIDKVTKPAIKAYLLFALYQATKDATRLDALFAFASVQKGPYDNVWSVFGMKDWDDGDIPKVMSFVAAHASEMPPHPVAEALSMFYYPKMPAKEAKKRLPAKDQIALVAAARRVALDTELGEAGRYWGLVAAGYFVPQAFPTLIGVILASPKEADRTKEYLREEIRRIRSDELTSNAPERSALSDLGFPNDDRNLSGWQQSPKVRKWTEAIMKDDLSSILNN